MTVKTAATVLAYGVGLILLLSLGTWQINRGLHKSNVLSLVEPEHKNLATFESLPEQIKALNYQSAKLRGHWKPQQRFLLDNRIHKGQAGYEILVPFQLTGGEYLLINRGWLPKHQSNAIPTSSGHTPIGRLYLPQKGYTIGEAIVTAEQTSPQWPKTSLYLDIELFSDILEYPLSPLVLVLDSTHPDSFTQIWKPVVVEPERHYAYALQWYGLAVVFVVFGVIWYRRARLSLSENR